MSPFQEIGITRTIYQKSRGKNKYIALDKIRWGKGTKPLYRVYILIDNKQVWIYSWASWKEAYESYRILLKGL